MSSEEPKTQTDDGPTINDGVERIDFAAELQGALEDAEDTESHVERNPDVFHPSQLAYCDRQAYLSKLGLKDTSDILGIFRTGTMIHEFIEEYVGTRVPRAEFEHPVEHTVGDITITGTCDCYDPETDSIADFKSRNGWYRFDPPSQRHVDQLLVYMAALDAQYGQVVYVSKGDMEVRTWPEDGLFEFDGERYDKIVAKAERIRDAIESEGIPESADDIPFEKCEDDCFICSNETLVFDTDTDGDDGGESE